MKAPWKLIFTAPGERIVLSMVDLLRGGWKGRLDGAGFCADKGDILDRLLLHFFSAKMFHSVMKSITLLQWCQVKHFSDYFRTATFSTKSDSRIHGIKPTPSCLRLLPRDLLMKLFLLTDPVLFQK